MKKLWDRANDVQTARGSYKKEGTYWVPSKKSKRKEIIKPYQPKDKKDADVPNR